MYGSSLRMETLRPRALSSRPTLAAVMPLPREEVTPPVTKTYFAMGRVLRGFFQCYRFGDPESNRFARSGRADAGGTRPPAPGAHGQDRRWVTGSIVGSSLARGDRRLARRALPVG